MRKIADLFRRRGGAGPPPRDVRALVAPLGAPAVQLVASDEASPSHLGGEPAAGAPSPWPEKDGRALSFLASLDLPSLSAAHAFAWLPSTGSLLFFFDVEAQPWGFDPADAGSWAVVHVPEGSQAPAPPGPARRVPRVDVRFRPIRTIPSYERPEIGGLDLTDDELGLLGDLLESPYGEDPPHQVGGFPLPIQGDAMELECQLVSNGLYCGDATGYRDPRADALRDGARDWRLLLQVASDETPGLMWGDLGNLYFWIREQDARAGRFDRAWVVLQCF